MENAGEQNRRHRAASITVVAATKGAEESIRIRVIFDGRGTTYARRQTARGSATWRTRTDHIRVLLTHHEVFNQELHSNSNQVDVLKVTIVIWYEGEDADHNHQHLRRRRQTRYAISRSTNDLRRSMT
ncbi:MAG: hypothetical protein MZU97_24340 [Bacillus subtilis]|nr:hypothetical protein [Bacillus subtilis]